MKIFAVKGRNVFSDYPYNPEIIEYYLSEDSAKSHVEKLNSETKNFDDEFGMPNFTYEAGAYYTAIDVKP